jgi:hypothetical protein
MKLLRSLLGFFPAKRGRVTWARKDQLPAGNENPLLIPPTLAVSKSSSLNVELQERIQAALQANYANNLKQVYGEDDHDIAAAAAKCKIVYAPPSSNKTV